jgi:hypothetical protein
MFRLPDAPQALGPLLTTSVQLWWASWRATFGYSLLVGLASLLPTLALGELVTALLREMGPILLREQAPWLPPAAGGDPLALLQAGWDWLRAPRTVALLAASMLLVLAGLQLVIHRQARIGRGRDGGFIAATRAAVARLPAGLAAWALYGVLLLLSALPLLLLSVLLYAWALQADSIAGLLLIALLYLIGGLLASVPIAWLSVAAGFAPFAAAMDDTGPLAAQRRSLQRVRGHWLHAAVAITVPLLLYLGAASLISSLLFSVCAAVAWSQGGWAALLQGDWLAWGHWLGLIPTAIALPLMTAGGVAVWHDLGLRNPSL